MKVSGPPCPHGFVIPDHSTPYTFYINRTMSECAAACRIAFFTDAEWHRFEAIQDAAVYIGCPMVSLFLYTYIFDYEKRSQYLVRWFGLLSLLHSVVTAVVQSVPFDERICRDNANSLGPSDGFTLCAFQSVMQLYCSLAISLCWMMQALNVFVKVVLGLRNVAPQKARHMAIIFGLPLISVAVMLGTDSYGYTKGSFGCVFNPSVRKTKIDLWIMLIPLAVIVSIGMVLMIAVLAKMFIVFGKYYHLHKRISPYSNLDSETGTPSPSSSSAPSTNSKNTVTSTPVSGPGSASGMPQQLQELDVKSRWDLMVYFRTPIFFLTFFLVLFTTVVVAGIISTGQRGIYLNSFREWGQCALDNYNGVDSSWHEVCGNHPPVRVSANARSFFAFLFAGQSVLMSIIYSQSIWIFLKQEYHAAVRIVSSLLLSSTNPPPMVTSAESYEKLPAGATVDNHIAAVEDGRSQPKMLTPVPEEDGRGSSAVSKNMARAVASGNSSMPGESYAYGSISEGIYLARIPGGGEQMKSYGQLYD